MIIFPQLVHVKSWKKTLEGSVSLTLKRALENQISYPDLLAKKPKAWSGQLRKFIFFGLATQTS